MVPQSIYNRQLNIKSSLIETFSTFILMSNVKILGLCFDLTDSTTSYNSTGNEDYLYYDANIRYFSPEHMPFFVFALCTGFLFVILPFFLLMMYPCRCFQRFLNCFGWRCQSLHIFMDAFQGMYKLSPYDMRYFSAFYFFLRFMALLSIVYFKSRISITITSALLICASFVIAVFRPYKVSLHNTMDTVTLLLAALFYLVISGDIISMFIDHHWIVLGHVFLSGSIILLFVYSIMLFCFMSSIPRTLFRCIYKSWYSL